MKLQGLQHLVSAYETRIGEFSTEIEFLLLSESFTESDLNAQAGSAEFFDNSLKLNFLDSGLSNFIRYRNLTSLC